MDAKTDTVASPAWRAQHYGALAARITQITQRQPFDIGSAAERPLPSFADLLVSLPDFLPADAFGALAADAERLLAPERSFIPTHKQGGTIAYETLIAEAPAIIAFYHAHGMRDLISRLTGVGVGPTPLNDQSSLSLLFYDKPGDHIGWHYDHNFYRGRHFTILLAIDNRGHAEGGLSHAVLRARLSTGEVAVRTAPNTLVVFEGARVRHVVSPIHAGERRLMLSMTYCADPRSHWWQGLPRRIKDTAYFGLRALWT